MSLTKQDLQQIWRIFEEKLESKLEEKLESKLDEKLESKLDAKFESKLAPIKKSLKKIEQKLDLTIRTFDQDFNYYHRRLNQL